MTIPEQPESGLPAQQKPVRMYKARGRIFGMSIAVLSIWTALYIVTSAIPALPVPGMAGLVAGLLFANKWGLARIGELLILGSWFINPQSHQTGMWMVPLPYSAIALLVILIKPVRD